MLQAGRKKLMASSSTKVASLLLPVTSPSTDYSSGKSTGGVRFVRSVQHDPRKPTGPTRFDNRFDNLDKAISKKNVNHEDGRPSSPSSDDNGTGDVMSRSYGEGYASRSEEEGFGGIYGGGSDTARSDMNKKKEADSFNRPAYDEAQGSEVKEKEGGRNSKLASLKID